MEGRVGVYVHGQATPKICYWLSILWNNKIRMNSGGGNGGKQMRVIPSPGHHTAAANMLEAEPSSSQLKTAHSKKILTLDFS